MSLIVFPAIDLKAGQVVRLAEGDMSRATIYADDPAEQAWAFAEAGARVEVRARLQEAPGGDSMFGTYPGNTDRYHVLEWSVTRL